MRRRSFVLGALLALAGAALGWRRIQRSLHGRSHAEVERDLREYYSYLRLDDDLLRAFLRDLERLPGRHHRDDLRRRFLLSTDFFVHGEDESRPLAYRAFHDAYLSPCASPFV